MQKQPRLNKSVILCRDRKTYLQLQNYVDVYFVFIPQNSTALHFCWTEEEEEDAGYTKLFSPAWKALEVDWLACSVWLINQGLLGGNEHHLWLIMFPQGKIWSHNTQWSFKTQFKYNNIYLNLSLLQH